MTIYNDLIDLILDGTIKSFEISKAKKNLHIQIYLKGGSVLVKNYWHNEELNETVQELQKNSGSEE